MWDRLMESLSSVDWDTLLANLSNERLVELFTNPYGLAVLGVLLLLSVLLKWRIVFVVIATAMAVAFLARSTLAGASMGPDRSMFLFIGGAVAVGAFVIYYLFIRED